MDKILENAFDFGAIGEEEEDVETPAKTQGASMTSSTSSDGAASNKHRISSDSSSWRSNRNSDVFTSETPVTDSNVTGTRTSNVYPEEPEPDYDVSAKMAKDPGDSGISDPGSLDDLNRDDAEQEPDYANVEYAQEALKQVRPSLLLSTSFHLFIICFSYDFF